MNNFKYDKDEISQLAQGHWIEIFKELAGHSSEILQAIENLGTTRHTWCPIHHGKHGDAFRLFPDFNETGMSICNTCGTFSPYSLLMELNGWTFPECLEAIAKCLGIEKERPKINSFSNSKKESERNREEEKEKNKKLLERLRKVWKESFPLSAPEAEPARIYFARRGLSFETFLSCGCLRFHPSLPYYNDSKEKIGEFPAILGVLLNTKREAITIHRIYITAEGKKAPVEKPKKLMSYPSDKSVCGSGVYLGFTPFPRKVPKMIGIAEGIETALAVREATGLPMIAATNAVLMEKLEIPENVKFITVWGDNDETGTGQKAVKNLCVRLKEQGKKVLGFIPPRPSFWKGKSWDWNNVLIHLGPHDFPKITLKIKF